MELEDMILISVDDHVVEPPDMWEGRVPKKYADQVPKLITQDDGTEAWEYLGQAIDQHRAQRRRRSAPGGLRHSTPRRSRTCAPAATTYTSGSGT